MVPLQGLQVDVGFAELVGAVFAALVGAVVSLAVAHRHHPIEQADVVIRMSAQIEDLTGEVTEMHDKLRTLSDEVNELRDERAAQARTIGKLTAKVNAFGRLVRELVEHAAGRGPVPEPDPSIEDDVDLSPLIPIIEQAH